jgi:hypothetical protein
VRVALGMTVLATATACGEQKVDPYENSLAQGSEHVEFHGVLQGRSVAGSGDFRGDRGTLTTRAGTTTVHQVVDGHRIFVRTVSGWRTRLTTGSNTPAQMFRKRLPATIEDDLVKKIVVGPITYEFSKYGEDVSVTLPRVKGR